MQEFMNKYGDVDVSFYSYYKSTLVFMGLTNNGELIEASIKDKDVHGLLIRFNEPFKISTLNPFHAVIYERTDEGDKAIEEYVSPFCD